jgi:hypothetical protein
MPLIDVAMVDGQCTGKTTGETSGGRVSLWQMLPFRQNKALSTSLRYVGRGNGRYLVMEDFCSIV